MADEIYAIAEKIYFHNRLSGNLIDAARLHATLLPFESYDVGGVGLPPDAVDRAIAVGETVRLDAAAFDITFDRLGVFNGHGTQRPVVLHCSRVPEAALSLMVALARAMGSSQDRFDPHITLLWDRIPVSPRHLEAAITLRIDKLVLIRSFYGKGYHQTFADWRLGEG